MVEEFGATMTTAVIVIDKVPDRAVALTLSVTFATNVLVPVADGVPEMTPVDPESVKPAGSDPLLMLHV